MAPWRKTLSLLLVCHAGITLIYSMMTPLLPLFIAELGVRGEGKIQLWAGITAAVTSATAALGAPVWGGLADRYGKKPLMLRATVGLAVVLAGFALCRSITDFLLLRLLQGILIGFGPAAMALAVQQVARERTAWIVSLFQTAGLVGAVVGPLLGGGIAQALGAIRPGFWALTAIAVVISLLVMLFVKERRDIAPVAERPDHAPATLARVLRESPLVRAMLIIITLTTFASAAADPILPLFVPKLRVSPDYLLLVTGLVFSCTGIATAVAAPWLGRQADRYGHRRILAACLGGAAVSFALQGISTSVWQLIGARLLLGLCLAGLVPVATAAVSRALGPTVQGRGFGLTYSATFLGGVLGPLSGGFTASTLGQRWVFPVAALLLTGTGAWTWFGRHRQPVEIATGRAVEAEPHAPSRTL